MARSRMAGTSAIAVAAVSAGLMLLPGASSAPSATGSFVDESTKEQLAKTARTVLEHRSQALVERSRPGPLPEEIFGVRISPGLASAQQQAVRELEARNRAPVAGGPAFTTARTRLKAVKAVRARDRITLDATEYTEVEYEPTGDGRPPVLVQAVRRRFEFKAEGKRLTLLAESRVGVTETPINDPVPTSDPAGPGESVAPSPGPADSAQSRVTRDGAP